MDMDAIEKNRIDMRIEQWSSPIILLEVSNKWRRQKKHAKGSTNAYDGGKILG